MLHLHRAGPSAVVTRVCSMRRFSLPCFVRRARSVAPDRKPKVALMLEVVVYAMAMAQSDAAGARGGDDGAGVDGGETGTEANGVRCVYSPLFFVQPLESDRQREDTPTLKKICRPADQVVETKTMNAGRLSDVLLLAGRLVFG